MLPEIRNYLEEVRVHLHLDPITEGRVLSELHTYFQEKITELKEQGFIEIEAGREAIKSFGRARAVARLLYEAHSRGSWIEAMKTSIPHLLIAGLFYIHLWHNPVLVPIVFLAIVGITLFGWWHGKPNWLYSWIGYSLFPLLLAGFISWPTILQAVFLLREQGTPPSWPYLLLVLVLYILSLVIIISTMIRAVKRDWILASLILVPLPILGSWLFNIEQSGGLFQTDSPSLHQWDAIMAAVLLVLAAASATFIRLRQRILKVGALTTIGVIAGTIAIHNIWGEIGFWGLLVTSILLLLFLLSPALLEARIGHGESREEAWWPGS
jgi:hypothetical protein